MPIYLLIDFRSGIIVDCSDRLCGIVNDVKSELLIRKLVSFFLRFCHPFILINDCNLLMTVSSFQMDTELQDVSCQDVNCVRHLKYNGSKRCWSPIVQTAHLPSIPNLSHLPLAPTFYTYLSHLLFTPSKFIFSCHKLAPKLTVHLLK
jgi:hypothetical protein